MQTTVPPPGERRNRLGAGVVKRLQHEVYGRLTGSFRLPGPVHLPCFAQWGDQPGATGQPLWYSTKSPRPCRISRVSAFVQAIALSCALFAVGPSATKGLHPHTLPALILRRPVPRRRASAPRPRPARRAASRLGRPGQPGEPACVAQRRAWPGLWPATATRVATLRGWDALRPNRPLASLSVDPSHVQGACRCMPHPQTYRDGAALSRPECTQSCVGISTYVRNAIRPNYKHTINSYGHVPSSGVGASSSGSDQAAPAGSNIGSSMRSAVPTSKTGAAR